VSGSRAGLSLSRRSCSLLGAVAGLLAIASGPAATPAAAEAPAHTDVMLLFNTNAALGSGLQEAEAGIGEVITKVDASLPEVEFGVAEVRDFWPSVYDMEQEEPESKGKPPSYPWKLDQPLTSGRTAVEEAVGRLEASGGGDAPEAYGRALWETDTNPTVGWRSDARHIIILVADNVPHDHNLNEGIPEGDYAKNEAGVVENPFDTGEELEGTWNIAGTAWASGDDTEFHADLQRLAHDGKTLGEVEYRGEETGYLPYWQHWAALTGGDAVLGSSEEFAHTVAEMIETRASTPPPACPSGESRNESGVCAAAASTSTTPPPLPSIPAPLPPSSPPPAKLLPPPVLGKTVNAQLVSGTVFVKLPGGAQESLAGPWDAAFESLSKGLGFVPLVEARQIPVGSILETTHGVVKLTAATAAAGKFGFGDFGAGIFKLLQNRAQRGLTELDIMDSRSPKQVCATVGKRASVASKHLSSTVLGRLTSSDHGKFTARGQYSAATVRGTVYSVTNECAGTLTQVSRGVVSVRDFARRKTIILHAGQHYLAKAPRGGHI
jgi:hypothetical protein